MKSRLQLICERSDVTEKKAHSIMESSILGPYEKQAFYLVRQIGYSPSIALEIMPGIFSVSATKAGERHNIKVDTNTDRIISNDLLVHFWVLNPDTDEYFIRDVKRFSRSIKE